MNFLLQKVFNVAQKRVKMPDTEGKVRYFEKIDKRYRQSI